jgi:two-component system LytT family sensor kinase
MSRVRAWLAVWTGWTALALFFAVSNSLTYKSTGRSANWTLTIKRSLSEWWLWAAATPLVVWLARRFPIHGPRLTRNLGVHVIVGAAVAVAKTFADRALFAWLTGFWTYLLVSTLALNFTIYAALVAAAHGVEYYRRSRERDHLEARLADARLQLLGMQLQPHFLFNTLNTIAELVHEDADAADAMISRLSDLLRRTLDLGSTQEISLGDELDLVSRYVDIQKARFGDRLRVDISVPEDLRGASVPALLLQPLVENAIRHGLGTRLDAGRIEIRARADHDHLTILVSDDGDGDTAAGPERVGLGNTRARLEALYGPHSRLELTKGDNGHGTRAIIRIPRAAERRVAP